MRQEKMPKLIHRAGGSILTVGGRPPADTGPAQEAMEDRTLTMIVVPYGEIIKVRTKTERYSERFERYAFDADLGSRDLEANPVKLILKHRHSDATAAIGKLTAWRDTAEGLQATFEVLDTRAGAEVLTQARAWVLQPSVGFIPIATRSEQGGKLRVRTQVKLDEVSLVPIAAYRGARILGTQVIGRARHPRMSNLDRAMLDLKQAELEAPRPRLKIAQAWLKHAERRNSK